MATRTFVVSKVNTSRKNDSGGGGLGAGAMNVARVGRWGSSGSRNYTSYVAFTLDWSNVGSISKAELVLTTSDNFGSTSAHPRVVIKRLSQNWSEGNHADWHEDDYRAPAFYSSAVAKEPMATAVDDTTTIDITGFVKAWAPASVPGGSARPNYGLGIYGTTDQNERFEFHGDEASAEFRPYIVLTFEYKDTIPDTPATNLSPVGDVASVDAFEGDFSDSLRPEDLLAFSQVQVFTNDAVKSGTASTGNTIIVTAHGFQPGQEVWFLSLTGGAGLSLGTRYYVRSGVIANAFKVATSPGGPEVDITEAYTALTVAKPLYAPSPKAASNTEVTTAHSFVLPTGFHPEKEVPYKWRLRQQDTEGVWSAWSALQTFTVTNTDPDAPVLTPDADHATTPADDFETLNGVVFRGSFTDADVDDTLLAFQVQLSDMSNPADPGWDDPSQLQWDSGKQYVASGETEFQIQYGGTDLALGTYYWRARVWDNNQGLSDWSDLARIVLLNDFDADPGSQTSVQVDAQAPWRVRIREMKYNSLAGSTGAITANSSTDLFTTVKNHGLTAGRKVRFSSITGGNGIFTDRTYYVIASGLADKTFRISEERGGDIFNFSTDVTAAVLTGVTTRGPGNTIAIIENAKSVGASIVFNSPGEAHFTLPIDHPMISVIEPRQVHYGIDFYTGDGWRETFAGLIWDLDATEREAVFVGVDYLALFDTIYDNRYFPSDPDRASSKGGSKYVNSTISSIISDQLSRAIGRANSPVGFITKGAIDVGSTARVTLWSTMQPCLSFVGGLIDSAREGSGRRTRIAVKRTGPSTYSVTVEADSGVDRDNLRLRYGELVNGYRVVVFGDGWASVVHGIGRSREGTRVMYSTASAPGIDPRIWGNIERAVMVDDVSDPVDLQRRLKQEAIKSGKLGQSMAIAVRVSFLKPLDGYNVCDALPVAIEHGAINTSNFGSGYFNIWAVAWEAGDDASQQVILTLLPREDTTAPAEDIIDAVNISTQQEWQVGWVPPDPLVTTAKYYLDQTTGIVYFRGDGDTQTGLTGTA